MKKNNKRFLIDYRNKIQTKHVAVRMPLDLVDWIGDEVQKRHSNFSAVLIDIIRERKEAMENDN